MAPFLAVGGCLGEQGSGVALGPSERCYYHVLTKLPPIALIANVVRITATGMAFHGFSGEAARAHFHGLSGWLMMPFALLLLWLELRFMSKLFVLGQETPQPTVLPVGNFGDLR